jgi:hypothetical protein
MRRILAALLFVLLPTQVFAANAYITEFSVLGTANNGAPQVATLPPVTHQKVDFSGGAASAAAFNVQTKYIRIHCDCRMLYSRRMPRQPPRTCEFRLMGSSISGFRAATCFRSLLTPSLPQG